MISTGENIKQNVCQSSYELKNNVLTNVPAPIISVRTSTYNHAPYIRKCIEGVLMQKTSYPIEYIIGEDCSTDGTRDIVFEYAQKYPNIIRVVTSDVNVGMTANGNRCIERCRGKYMAICEGDDYWTDPYKLQKQIDFLEANPGFSMCFHPVDMICEANVKVYNPFVNLEEREYAAEEIINNWIIPTQSAVFRKKFQEQVPKHPNFKVGDVVLFLTLAKCGRVYCMKDNMAVYRRHASGWTMKNPIKAATDLLIHNQAMQEVFPEYRTIFDKHIIKCYRSLVIHNFIQGCKRYGYKMLWSFIRLPFEKIYQLYRS